MLPDPLRGRTRSFMHCLSLRLLIAAILGLIATNGFGADSTSRDAFRIVRTLESRDSGSIILALGAKDSGAGPVPANGWAEFRFSVPATGWYVLNLKDMPNLARAIYIDNRRVKLTFGVSGKSAAELLGMKVEKTARPEYVKEVNLYLTDGEHTLKIERLGRMGFPAGLFRSWELSPAGGAATDRISVQRQGPDAMRKGETLRLAVTAGGDNLPAEYEIIRINGLSGEKTTVARVAIAASVAAVTRTVEIPCDEEGVFHLLARCAEVALSAADFAGGSYVVIDTKTPPPVAQRANLELLEDIDCVANVINGKPVQEGINYWEGNGKTRLNESEAGKYRETNDCRGEGVVPDPQKPARNFSGLAYQVAIPAGTTPFLLEIDHPDDDWRSVCVSICDIYDESGKKGFLPPAFGYETGGVFPLSRKMLTERVVFWSNASQVHLGLVSARLGRRAAVARMRLYRVNGPLPAIGSAPAGGRFMGAWLEEKDRWHIQFNTPTGLPDIVRDYIGLRRWAELCSYTGMNALWPTEAAYQQTTYDSEVLKGYLTKDHDAVRISALFCEKFGIKYVPEIFLAKQRYFNEEVMTAGAAKPADLYDTTRWGFCPGASREPGGLWPTWNILHPQVQQKMIDVYGELADKVKDSPAFVGMSGRLDSWLWDGLYAVTSLNWGYGDWTIAQFEKDCGVRVPGAADDPKRFEARYRFLTETPMKERWLSWRCERVTAFLLRLRDRIRGSRGDVTLYLCGSGIVDENHGYPAGITPTQRMREMGIDPERLRKIAGIALAPVGGYGRGKTRTYLAEQKAYDQFIDPANKNLGFGLERAFAYGNQYTEWGSEFPLDKLGDPLKNSPRYAWYTGASDAAGENSLERLAVVLADQDTLSIREGGYGYFFGQREIRGEWLREFTALPRQAFQPLLQARDPVAVWRCELQSPAAGSGLKAGYYFYAVNRERYPVKLNLSLSGTDSVTRLVDGSVLPVADGRLTMELEPFALRGFLAPIGSSIRAAETVVAEQRIVAVRKRLAYAQHIAEAINGGIYSSSISPEEKAAFNSLLNEAWTSFQAAHYWRARTALSQAGMMSVYERCGGYPQEQLYTRFPGLLEFEPTDRFAPPEEFLDAQTLLQLRKEGATGALADSESYEREWRLGKIVESVGGTLTLAVPVPAAGEYRLSVGFVAKSPGVIAATIDGRSLPLPLQNKTVGQPERLDFPVIKLSAGTMTLKLQRPDTFGVYGLKLVPVLRALPSSLWLTAGPFKSFWGQGEGRDGQTDEAVKKGMLNVYPPEKDPRPNAIYRDNRSPDRGELRWSGAEVIEGNHADSGVNFTFRTASKGCDFNYAMTCIESPQECEALLYLGTDWWANAWLNGVPVQSGLDQKTKDACGCEFNRWKPLPAKVSLKQGRNILLVKNQGGSAASWFTCYLSKIDGLKIYSPKP